MCFLFLDFMGINSDGGEYIYIYIYAYVISMQASSPWGASLAQVSASTLASSLLCSCTNNCCSNNTLGLGLQKIDPIYLNAKNKWIWWFWCCHMVPMMLLPWAKGMRRNHRYVYCTCFNLLKSNQQGQLTSGAITILKRLAWAEQFRYILYIHIYSTIWWSI